MHTSQLQFRRSNRSTDTIINVSFVLFLFFFFLCHNDYSYCSLFNERSIQFLYIYRFHAIWVTLSNFIYSLYFLSIMSPSTLHSIFRDLLYKLLMYKIILFARIIRLISLITLIEFF